MQSRRAAPPLPMLLLGKVSPMVLWIQYVPNHHCPRIPRETSSNAHFHTCPRITESKSLR